MCQLPACERARVRSLLPPDSKRIDSIILRTVFNTCAEVYRSLNWSVSRRPLSPHAVGSHMSVSRQFIFFFVRNTLFSLGDVLFCSDTTRATINGTGVLACNPCTKFCIPPIFLHPVAYFNFVCFENDFNHKRRLNVSQNTTNYSSLFDEFKIIAQTKNHFQRLFWKIKNIHCCWWLFWYCWNEPVDEWKICLPIFLSFAFLNGVPFDAT